MTINYDDPHLYHHLCLIIDAFEKKAIRSSTRMGFLVAAQGPLSAFDTILKSTDKVLNETNTARQSSASQERVSVDDFRNLVDDDSTEANRVEKYLQDCLGCDLRLQFDWQLKPFNLLPAIEELLDSIKASLDPFLDRIDPFKTLQGLCELLNALKGLCIPDLIMVLMALKLLMKKYLTSVLEIRLNWTTVLGPLLKLVLDAITSLLNSLMALLLAPLDCAISALVTVNELEKQARTTINALDNLFSSTLKTSSENDLLIEDIGWANSNLNDKDTPLGVKVFGEFPEGPKYGTADVDFRFYGEEPEVKGPSIPVGFNVRQESSLIEAMKKPEWATTTFIERLIVPLQEVREYIVNLVGAITKSLNSLNALCSGGIGLNLSQLGALMFLADLISVVLMIITMLKNHPGEMDWCRLLQENPGLLETQLRERFGSGPFQLSNLNVEVGDGDRLLLQLDGKTVGEVKTCANKRTELDSQVLQRWISELENKR